MCRTYSTGMEVRERWTDERIKVLLYHTPWLEMKGLILDTFEAHVLIDKMICKSFRMDYSFKCSRVFCLPKTSAVAMISQVYMAAMRRCGFAWKAYLQASFMEAMS